jgi:hypothetical protein
LFFNKGGHYFNEDVYEPGRQYVGFGRTYIRLPRRYVSFSFGEGGDVC